MKEYREKSNYEELFLQNEFKDDIVFARFINYMQMVFFFLHFFHKKQPYIK